MGELTIQSPDRELVKEIAMDIGKDVAEHIERMWPDAVAASSSTFLLSVRNCTYNNIMAALEVMDADAIRARLKKNAAHRRELRKLFRSIRRTAPQHDDAQGGDAP